MLIQISPNDEYKKTSFTAVSPPSSLAVRTATQNTSSLFISFSLYKIVKGGRKT